MTKFSIELNDTIVVAMRNGASVEVQTSKLDSVIGELLAYGLGQKVRDSASQASTLAGEDGDVKAIALGLMEACVSKLYAGDWSVRGEGTGTDPRVLVARSIVRKAIKEKFGSKSKDWAKFTGLSDKDQLAKLDETYEANKELFDPLVSEEMDRRAKASKAKASAAKSLTITL